MIRTWSVLIILVLADSAGSMLLARGMRQVGEVRGLDLEDLLRLARRAASNMTLALGIFCMTIAFFMLMALLSWSDISFVWPATALTEPVNMLGSRFILKEKVTRLRWASMIFIGTGIYLVSINS